MLSSRTLHQNSNKTHSNKYEFITEEFYTPIKNILYIVQNAMQFHSTLCISVHAIAVTDSYTAFSDTNRQIVLSLY